MPDKMQKDSFQFYHSILKNDQNVVSIDHLWCFCDILDLFSSEDEPIDRIHIGSYQACKENHFFCANPPFVPPQFNLTLVTKYIDILVKGR